jgi:hypothetical protein
MEKINLQLTPRQIEIIVEMFFTNYSSLDDEQVELYELLNQHMGAE